MLPIAAEIATRMTREHAGSALPGAPTLDDTPEALTGREVRRPRRTLASVLRGVAATSSRVAATSGRLADRMERPAAAE
ncbi:MAG: hypothetical protein ACRDYU_05545 [Actinomycetes bacterium]